MLRKIPNFMPGPLDVYRKQASFNWKKLKLFLDTEDIIEYQNEVYKELERHPEYRTTTSFQNFDEIRHHATRQAEIYKSIELLSLESTIINLRRPATATRITMGIAPSSTIKNNVSCRLFSAAVRNMGTEKHLQYIDDIDDGKILGCYCLTEIGHGSNTRGMRTTATYNEEKKKFILNSPDFEAAKCWAGGLGQGATHAVIYAQLILKNVSYGLHAFVVPIRDPKNHSPYPGLVVGDMGEKIGLNGVDNGFVAFNNYEIPRDNLLNKLGDVTDDGEYVTPIKDPNKRHGAALGSLSAGRVTITCISETMGIKALTIAIRYAAVRKQFGPDDEEIPILEYQSHQHRLLPYLAAAYVIRIFNDYLTQTFYQFSIDTYTGSNKETLPDLGMEIHAISSSCKPVAGWTMKDAIQECRETCGGHGYLKAAGIGDLRNDHDANLTYEGENHILIQQTSNWLLKLWPLVLQNKKISTPLQSADFLSNALEMLSKETFNATTVEELCVPEYILSIYRWLICYLLKSSYEKIENELKCGRSAFWAKNDSQVYYAKSLAVLYIQHFFLQRMLVTVSTADDPQVKQVLTKLYLLYGLWSLEKHMPILYKSEFARGPQAASLIQTSVLKLCADLKNDAVSLVDAVAPPDFILNSVLGASDGMVYKRLESAIRSVPYFNDRPKWWKEFVNGDKIGSKL